MRSAQLSIPSSVVQDWQTLDARSEIQHTRDVANTMKLFAAVDSIRPSSAVTREAGLQNYLAEQLKSRPDEDYDGPILNWPLTQTDLTKLEDHYVQPGHCELFEGYVCRIVHAATEMFAALPSLTRIVSVAGEHKRLVVVGDLHGQLADLYTIFIEYGFPNPAGNQFLFNGDFVDRGEDGLEITILLLAYKLVYPNTVHLNRGNHETQQMNQDYGFLAEITVKYYGRTQLFRLFLNLWNQLPIVSLIDEVGIVLHAGLFRQQGVTLDKLSKLPKVEADLGNRSLDLELMCDAIWNDPYPGNGVIQGKRGPGSYLFGPDVTRSFLALNKLRWLIRSHEVPPNNRGFYWTHNDQLLTLFSASNYCGAQGNAAAVGIINQLQGAIECVEYDAPPLDFVADQLGELRKGKTEVDAFRRATSVSFGRQESMSVALDGVISVVEDQIIRYHGELVKFYQNCPQVNGCITRNQWHNGLAVVLDLDINWEEYAPFLIQDAEIGNEDVVDWRKFLEQYQVITSDGAWVTNMCEELRNRLVERDLALPDYYKLFDPEGNGIVNAQKLLRGMNGGLGFHLTEEEADRMAETMAGPANVLDIGTFLSQLQIEYKGKNQPPAVQRVLQAIEALLQARRMTTVEMFKEIDKNEDGKICEADLAVFLDWLSQTDPSYADFTDAALPGILLAAFDENNSGEIDLLEFMDNFNPTSHVSAAHVEAEVQRLARALYMYRASLGALFLRMSGDDGQLLPVADFADGLVTLAKAVELDLTPGQAALVSRHLDSDNDGVISYQEFLQAFQSQGASRTSGTGRRRGSRSGSIFDAIPHHA